MNGTEISRPRATPPIPVDRELLALVRSRESELRGDPEWDLVLSRFIDWAVDDGDAAAGDSEPGELELDPTASLHVIPPR